MRWTVASVLVLLLCPAMLAHAEDAAPARPKQEITIGAAQTLERGQHPVEAARAYRNAAEKAESLSHLDLAASAWHACGRCLFTAGDLSGTQEAWTRTLELERKRSSKRALVTALRNLAYVLGTRGFHERALPHLAEASRLLEKDGTPDLRTTTLLALGIEQARLGMLPGARASLERALPLAQEAGLKRTEAAILSAGGVVALRAGDAARARMLLQSALKVRRAVGDRPGEAATLANLGLAHLAAGELEAAATRLEAARRIQVAEGLALDAAQTLENLAQVRHRSGNSKEALGLLGEARGVFEIHDDLGSLAAVLETQGIIHLARGEVAAALSALERCLGIREHLEDAQGVESVLANLGVAFSRASDWRRAMQCFQRGLAAASERADDSASAVAWRNMGAVHLRANRPEDALEAFERSLQGFRARKDAAGEISALANVGGAQLQLGRHETAVRFLQQAFTLAQTSQRPDLAAAALGNLGLAHFRRGDHDEAIRCHEEAIGLARSAGAERTLALNNWGLAEALLAKGELRAGLKLAREAATSAENVVQDLDEIVGPRAHEDWCGLFELALRAAAKLGDVDTAFWFVEHGRARGLIESLGARMTGAATIPHALRQAESTALEAELKAVRAHRRAVRIGRLREVRSARKALDSARRKVEDAVAGIQRAEKAARKLATTRPVERSELQALLAPGDTFVLYAVLSDTTYALVLTHDEGRIVSLGESARISDACSEEICAQAGLPYRERVQHMRTMLIEPLKLPADTKRLIISPHARLGFVPFALLAPGRDFALVPSATTYAVLGSLRTQRGSRVLALGDPDYGAASPSSKKPRVRGGRHLAPLPATREEAKAIGQVLLLGADASESALRRTLESEARWRSVHFACHGVWDREDPLRSALALTPEPSGDGLLTALDVLRLRIPTDLVVLSGCETGRGQAFRSEGIVGLTRAFMCAGAPRVLVSLWKVEDEATNALMTKFYELWNPREGDGTGAVTALRAAQEHVKSQEQWKDPYYWAGWVLWGLPD